MCRDLRDFVIESNAIEGITRSPGPQEIGAYRDFLALVEIGVEDLEIFVRLVQPGAELRVREGMNVRVGNHFPPRGGPRALTQLESLLERVNKGADPYETHKAYETLHPFTDGNGRSGRALFLWQLSQWPDNPMTYRSFLHHWYYLSLENAR